MTRLGKLPLLDQRVHRVAERSRREGPYGKKEKTPDDPWRALDDHVDQAHDPSAVRPRTERTIEHPAEKEISPLDFSKETDVDLFIPESETQPVSG